MPRAAAAGPAEGVRRRRRTAARETSLEQRMLLTATMCLLAFGAVMVYSASSARTLLHGGGYGSAYLLKFFLFGGVGLALMHVLARDGVAKVHAITAPLLVISLVLVAAVHIPHVGVSVNGARRWIGPGPAPVPALRAAEDRARALLGHAVGQATRLRARPARADAPAADGRGGGLPARVHAAGPRNGVGDRLHGRDDADRLRDPAREARADRAAACSGWCCCTRWCVPTRGRG